MSSEEEDHYSDDDVFSFQLKNKRNIIVDTDDETDSGSLFIEPQKKTNDILKECVNTSDYAENDSNILLSSIQSENSNSDVNETSNGNVFEDSYEKPEQVVVSTPSDTPVTSDNYMRKSFIKHRSNIVNLDSEDDESISKISFSDSSDEKEGVKISDTPSYESFNSKPHMSSTLKKQLTLHDFMTKEENYETHIQKREESPIQSLQKKVKDDDAIIQSENTIISCKRSDYNLQVEKIKKFEEEMMKIQRHMSKINMAHLPDKGQLMKNEFQKQKSNFLTAQQKLRNMYVIEEDDCSENQDAHTKIFHQWENIQAGIAAVQPKTFGTKGLETHRIEQALTGERLEQLHGSMKNCPTEETLADDPKGLKVTLMNHQKRALAWLLYRETQKPAGGILADDMGLGKTLTMLSLILESKSNNSHKGSDDENSDEESSSGKRSKYKGRTLIICPASLIQQWEGEINSKMKRALLSYEIYHGPKRETKPKRLCEHDVVITTYSIVQNEIDKNGAIFRIKWERLILDEAHQIRNHKSRTSVACCELASKKRWALTGTPVHNKELDMYALLKFLRCSPFDDLAVWKRWVGDKSSGGGERLHTVISSLMLRRTKTELMEKGKMVALPARKWELISVSLDEEETAVYHKVLLFSQTLFAQFLHQRAEKNQDIINSNNPNNNDPNSEYFKMRQKIMKMNKMKNISQHEILVLILRLRQICCHASLITGMLQGDEDLGEEDTEDREDINLLEQLNKLNLNEDSENFGNDFTQEGVGLNEAVKNILNPSHPVFEKNRKSSKIKKVMEYIPHILSTRDKIIIVSQWRSYLELLSIHLINENINYLSLDGTVPTMRRTQIIDDFNRPTSKYRILLLSLTAGGVGLNLVGANHLFLLDLHWNPQLEKQAQDRIYRLGQQKEVYVYKFMAAETIEERIKSLQENKLQIADSMMTGSKQVIGNKLTLQDLKLLFNM